MTTQTSVNSGGSRSPTKRVAIRCLLCSVAISCYGADMASVPDIRVSPGNSEYVSIATHDTKGFDALVTRLIPHDVAALALQLKPYLFVVSNPSSRTVVAYCITMEATFANGTKRKHSVSFTDPVAALTKVPFVSGQYEQLVPGRHRVISVGMVFNAEARFNDLSWISLYRAYLNQQYPRGTVKQLELAVDAAILDDGTVKGPDTAELGSSFMSDVSALRAIVFDVMGRVKTGHSLPEIFASLQQSGNQVAEQVDKGDTDLDEQLIRKVNAAGSALRLWKRSGDAEFLKLAGAVIDSEPFTVRHQN